MEIRGSFPPEAGGPAPVATPVVTPVPEHAGLLSSGAPRQQGTWRFTAPARETSVPELRHTVRDLLRRQGGLVPDEVLHSVLLILCELVTNSVRHAALLSPEIGVEVTLSGGWLRVAVEDSHPYRPKALIADPDQQETGGRGLLLVKTLTAESGGICDVEQTGVGGKVVWAALPLALH